MIILLSKKKSTAKHSTTETEPTGINSRSSHWVPPLPLLPNLFLFLSLNVLKQIKLFLRSVPGLECLPKGWENRTLSEMFLPWEEMGCALRDWGESSARPPPDAVPGHWAEHVYKVTSREEIHQTSRLIPWEDSAPPAPPPFEGAKFCSNDA